MAPCEALMNFRDGMESLDDVGKGGFNGKWGGVGSVVSVTLLDPKTDLKPLATDAGRFSSIKGDRLEAEVTDSLLL